MSGTLHKDAERTVLVTVRLSQAGTDTLTRYVGDLRSAVRQTQVDHAFRIEAWVTLPDHFHCVLTLAGHGQTDESVVASIKGRFVALLGVRRPCSAGAEQAACDLWRGTDEVEVIVDQRALSAAITRCNLDPVRHGLVTDPFDWPYSSIHRDMRAALRAGQARANRLDPVGRQIRGPAEQAACMTPLGGNDRQSAVKTGELWPNAAPVTLPPKRVTR